MNTRTAQPGTPLRQERWASEIREDERGILAGLVSSQSNVPDHLKWFVQWRSWQPEGLGGLAREILAEGKYRATRRNCVGGDTLLQEDVCRVLVELANSPRVNPSPHLLERLEQIRDDQKARAFDSIAATAVAKAVHAGLDRCKRSRFNGLFIGPSRSGKSTAARAWCLAQGGMARLVQTPGENDISSLARAVAEAIGTATSFGFTAKQVKERMVSAVKSSPLMLVFDNAHLLWPQGDVRQSHPKRLQWLVTLMESTNVCLIATPQWADNRREFIGATGWAVDQLEGRLGVVEMLPDYDEADCRKIVRAMFPTADRKSEGMLIRVGMDKYRRLGALDSAVADAMGNATANGRTEVGLADVLWAAKNAMNTEGTLSLIASSATRRVNGGKNSDEAASRQEVGRAAAYDLPPPSRSSISGNRTTEPQTTASRL